MDDFAAMPDWKAMSCWECKYSETKPAVRELYCSKHKTFVCAASSACERWKETEKEND